jgi:hypothetical protein
MIGVDYEKDNERDHYDNACHNKRFYGSETFSLFLYFAHPMPMLLADTDEYTIPYALSQA